MSLKSVISESKRERVIFDNIKITFNCGVRVVTIQEDRKNYFIQSVFLVCPLKKHFLLIQKILLSSPCRIILIEYANTPHSGLILSQMISCAICGNKTPYVLEPQVKNVKIQQFLQFNYLKPDIWQLHCWDFPLQGNSGLIFRLV